MKKYTTIQKLLIILFTILYVCVGFVSLYHAIDFFSLSNATWLATILAGAFEIGQAAVLFALLTQNEKKAMPWILMIILTAVQCLGNIFASYKYMILHNSDQLQYFTDSILFFVKNPNPLYNQVMISYITGAILPIVALCMTGMVVGLVNKQSSDEIDDPQPVLEEAPVEQVSEEPKPVTKPKKQIKKSSQKQKPKVEEKKEEPKVEVKKEPIEEEKVIV